MSNTQPPPRAWFHPAESWALFLDFDGTLLALSSTPSAIRVPSDLPALLRRLDGFFSGAMAILTGRSLDDLDRYLAPPMWPAAGQHGAEMRQAPGGESVMRDTEALDTARVELKAFAGHQMGILLEDKGASIALHYRDAPEAREAAKSRAEALATASGGDLTVTAGKSVFEVGLADVSKGAALRQFLDAPPFEGRKPLVLGDDATDETAFETAPAMDGIAIKVGRGPTAAPWRLGDSAAVRGWLAELCG